tara:strand:- start:254 stop:835 length:582 start_codon:yes stop_codon:yes gene_type:complete
MKKIGLLGGSFDPPHRGHLFISLEAKKILKLSEIWWLITPKNPLKINKPASYLERINNCKKFVKNHPIKIKQYEKKINSSYSYLTIKYLNNKYKHIKFFWLMGADNLIHFHKWQKWRNIFNDLPVVVFKRHGYNNRALSSLAKKTYSNFQIHQKDLQKNIFAKCPAWILLNNKEIKISSSEIRLQRETLRGKN